LRLTVGFSAMPNNLGPSLPATRRRVFHDNRDPGTSHDGDQAIQHALK
jgi:hypothetical protein